MTTERTRERFAQLQELLSRHSQRGRWLVLTHDNPDPDSIAGAAALTTLLRRSFRRKVTIAYGGIVGRAENRQMVRTLGLSMSHIRHINWKHYRHYALVDCQPGTGNSQLPDHLAPDLVFDHHPVRRATRDLQFADVRIDYGATATILAEYLMMTSAPISRATATALLYAISTETQDFRREFSPADRVMYDQLRPLSDFRALAKIQSPPLSLAYFHTLHRAVERMSTVSTLVVSHLGPVDQPDIVPEVADLLLRLEGKTWSLCTGIFETRLYLSMRTTNPRADAGHLMQRLLGRRGKGGGHGMTAGGWVAIDEVRNGKVEALQARLAARLAKMLKKNPDRLQPIDWSSIVGKGPEETK
jgi:nanoRNase/pAp phosphatase (c-di-AMP/oligoRNAs hydrolase)